MFDVGDRGPPRVVELVERLHAEPARDLLRLRDSRLEILERHVLEPDLACAAGVERDGAEAAELVVGDAAAQAAGVVEKRAQDVGIEDELDVVPLARLQAGDRPGDRRLDAARHLQG